MASPHLSNYLRANRKRLGLSQEEVSFLLGTESGSKACRHEKFTRTPSLATALAYEAILGTAVRELFPGLYRKIEREVIVRAKMLLKRMQRMETRDVKSQSAEVLQTIIQRSLNSRKRT